MSSSAGSAGGISLRTMQSIDVSKGQELSAGLQWPHRREDWAQMYRLSEGAVLEADGGSIVGTCFTALQGSYATIGLVIVDPAYQGRKLGQRLMKWAIDVAEGRSIVLNATKAGLPLYEKLGFRSFNRIHQYQGQSVAEPSELDSSRIRLATSGDFDRIVHLADSSTAFSRQAVIAEFCAIARKVVVVEENGHVVGFGISRPFGRGYAIGPVVAHSQEQARQLVASLLTDLQESFVRIDVTDQSGLEDIVQGAGLALVGQVPTMVLGEEPPAAPARQFAVASQALD